MYMIQTFCFTVATIVFVHRPKHASFVIYSEQCVYPTEAAVWQWRMKMSMFNVLAVLYQLLTSLVVQTVFLK